MSLRTSVVVTVLNDAAGIATLIEALLRQTRPPDEIVIVDGGSSDQTRDVVVGIDSGAVALRCIKVQGANIAEGRNHGILEAAHEIIACTDAGCAPEPCWLEELVRPLDDPDVMVVGGAYRLDARTAMERVVGLFTMPGQLDPVDPLRFNPSARSIAFRVSAWRRAGGFPDWLYTAEDTLFDCKLRKLELCFAYASDAVVRWRPRTSVKAVWKQFREYARGEGRIARGADSIRFWTRRYLLATACAVICGTGFAFAVSPLLLVVGVVAAFGSLVQPVHARAARIARRTANPIDYLRAIILGHWIALAGVVGTRLGLRDRRRQPEVFVRRLVEYWGAESVGDVPPWPMKNPPAPRTLVVAWHWPPACRASTSVLASLFRYACPECFSVLTRELPQPPQDNRTPEPLLPTERVRWPLGDDRDETLRDWAASIWTACRMVARARRMHRHQPFKRILAVYPNRWGFFAGWIVSRLIGVPLVAYMHDLMAETILTRRRSKRAFWTAVDRAALSRASMVIVPTREFAEHYRCRGVTGTWVLPHCAPADVSASEVSSREPPEPGAVLELAYFGSVYQAHEQAVEVLVDAAQRLDDVNLSVCSNAHPAWQGVSVQWLPRSRTLARMAEADVLVVLLGAQTPYPSETHGCFPSKIVDYLATGRPLLAIVPHGSFVHRFIRETGCGIAVTSCRSDTRRLLAKREPSRDRKGANTRGQLMPRSTASSRARLGSPVDSGMPEHYDAHDVVSAIEVLRDPDVRRRMIEAGWSVIEQLSPKRWAGMLARRLAYGPPDDPATPRFPVVPNRVIRFRPLLDTRICLSARGAGDGL